MLPRRLSCFRGSLFYRHGQILVVVGDNGSLRGGRSVDASECYSDSIYWMVEEDGGAFIELLRLFRSEQS